MLCNSLFNLKVKLENTRREPEVLSRMTYVQILKKLTVDKP